VLREEKPDMILSTGAGVAVPFFYLAKSMGIKTVLVESITRINELSMTAKLVYPIVDELLVQWEELAAKFPKAEFHGRIV
jgi:UDP-N-acetylglucosamine:LPS N-acetylglucosamine transferase